MSREGSMRDWDDETLGAGLRSATGELFPPTPPLAEKVGELLRREEAVPTRSRSGGVFAAAAVLAALLVGPFFFSPALRDAAADFFGVPGVRIEVTDQTSPTEPSPAETAVPELGDEVGLAAAQTEVPFRVRVPEVIGAPERVFFAREVSSGLVTLVYDPRPGLRASKETGAGLLIMQFEGSVEEAFFKKLAGPGTRFDLVDLEGETAFWISGAPHPIGYMDPHGNFAESPARLAANTLLFTNGGVTYRIEGDITLQKALEIASSL
jgi:hypothetical protein